MQFTNILMHGSIERQHLVATFLQLFESRQIRMRDERHQVSCTICER